MEGLVSDITVRILKTCIRCRLLDSISEHTEQRQGDNRRSQMEKLVRDELEKWDTDMDNKQAEAVQAHLKQEESKIAIQQDNSFE